MLLVQGGREAGHGGSDGPRDRDRARAMRRVRAGGVPGGDHRPALQAIRDHDCGGRHHFGIRGAHAESGPLRLAADTGPAGGATWGLLEAVQPGFRMDPAPLHGHRAVGDQAGDAGAGDRGCRGAGRLVAVAVPPAFLPAGGGPGLLHHHGPTAGRGLEATDHRSGQQARAVLPVRSGAP